MKKITINGITYWYNTKINSLFYDYRMTRQAPVSLFNNSEYLSFLQQIKSNP